MIKKKSKKAGIDISKCVATGFAAGGSSLVL